MNQPQSYILTRDLPAIPAKRYFTIGEVSQLCDVRSYVLRYWEQEFTQLSPMKRRGNRRYYQLHEVELVRKIRELLYEQGFTIAGARLQLEQKIAEDVMAFELSPLEPMAPIESLEISEANPSQVIPTEPINKKSLFSSADALSPVTHEIIQELLAIRALLIV